GDISADRVLDPVAAGVAALQDDLEQAPTAQRRHGPAADCEGKTVADDLHDMGQLAALCFGKMIEIRLHDSQPCPPGVKEQPKIRHRQARAAIVDELPDLRRVSHRSEASDGPRRYE